MTAPDPQPRFAPRRSKGARAIRTRFLSFRATPAEAKALERDARRAGRTLTKFMREKLGLKA